MLGMRTACLGSPCMSSKRKLRHSSCNYINLSQCVGETLTYSKEAKTSRDMRRKHLKEIIVATLQKLRKK